MSVILFSPQEVSQKIALAARSRRLSLNLSQQSASEKSGVSLGVIKKFERTGKISLESLLKLALVFDSLNDFLQVFAAPPPESFPTLDSLLQQAPRKRGRR